MGGPYVARYSAMQQTNVANAKGSAMPNPSIPGFFSDAMAYQVDAWQRSILFLDTMRKRGLQSCPSPYPPISELPPFDLKDLDGKRVTAASLKGKPTLINFFFSTCVPCILEVKPLNGFAAQRPQINFLAVTFDEADVARAFVNRFDFRWRIVPDARDFVDRVRVKNYPMMALFDANGRLLGTRRGGARDELEAANVAPQLALWMDGLLRQAGK